MAVSFPPRRCYTVPLPRDRALRLGERVLVMGILNITPDSFGEAQPRLDPGAAIEAALAMEAEGADLIDIGGESTRPGADLVSSADEAARVLPVVGGLAGRLRIPMSIDTYKAEVARQAIEAGAEIVNDISGLQYEPALGGVVAETGAALVLMHTRGRSRGMYEQAQYEDVVGDLMVELRARVACALAAGVAMERLILDPGIGFAKHAAHSYGVLARISELADLGRPLLVGPSRKSFLREALADRPAPQRDWGTAAAVTAAVLGGAHIVRVHAVAEMVQVVRVAEAIRKACD